MGRVKGTANLKSLIHFQKRVSRQKLINVVVVVVKEIAECVHKFASTSKDAAAFFMLVT